jgi:hypothetical protein
VQQASKAQLVQRARLVTQEGMECLAVKDQRDQRVTQVELEGRAEEEILEEMEEMATLAQQEQEDFLAETAMTVKMVIQE